MKKIFLILALISTVNIFSKNFTVMTYNIYGGRNSKASVLAEHIKEYNPDFICLQEVDKNTLRSGNTDYTKDIADILGYKYYYFRKARDFNFGEFGISIISKHPLEIIYVHTLASTDEEKRQVVMTKLKDEDILIVNTHLSFEEKENKEQINEFIRVIDSVKSKNKIICGDFNVLPKTQGYENLVKNFVDTYSDLEKPRIDYIFTNNKKLMIKKSSFLDKEKDLSDHLPYQVEFEF